MRRFGSGVRKTPFLPSTLAFIAVVAGIVVPVLAQEVQAPAGAEGEVGLAELLAFAEANAPAIRAANIERGYAEAARFGALPVLRPNPTLQVGVGPRLASGGRDDYDVSASLMQPVEVAGERALRLAAADRELDRREAEATAVRWAVRREVVLAFAEAVVARERLAAAGVVAAFSRETAAIAARRLAAGEVGEPEVRLAEAEAAEAEAAAIAEAHELRSATLRLCEVTGWAPETAPRLAGGLPPPVPVPPLELVLRAAAERNPELRVRRATVAEAAARAELADREAWPVPSFGVQFTREGSTGGPVNDIVLGSVAVPLPLWQRNREERARARVDETRTLAAQEATARTLRLRIEQAHSAATSSGERLALFRSGVVPALEQALSLLRRGVTAGEIALGDAAVARDRLLRARNAELAAHADHHRAVAELECAVGTHLSSLSTEPGTGGAP